MLAFIFKNNAQTDVDSTTIFFNQKKYDKALKFADKNSKYDSLIEKGIALYNNNDFINSLSFLTSAYNLNEHVNDEIQKISLLNIIGQCYEQIKDFEKTEKSFKKAIALNTSFSDKYFETLNSLCNLYSETKDFATAEKQCKLFLGEAKKHKGENSNEYLLSLNNLTLFYLSNDSFKLAEENCLKFVEINKLMFGDKSIEYLGAFSTYINLLIREGKLIEAEKYSSDLIKISLNLQEKNYKQIALSYSQLATIQQNLFKYDLAKSNFLKAVELIEKNYGTDNPYYALFTANLGVLCTELNNFPEADFFLKKALEIKVKLEDLNNNSIYHNLAAVYQNTNRCGEAEKYQLKSIENEKNKLSETYKTKVLGLALIYNCLNNSQKEFESLLTVSSILKKNVMDITTYMSNNEIQQYIQQYFHHRIYLFSFLTRQPLNFEELNISCFEEELMFKNLTINNSKFLQNSIRNFKNVELNLNYSTFIENKKKIARQNESPNERESNENKNLIFQTEKLEKYMVKYSKEFSKSSNISIKWDVYKSKLKQNEVVIDFVHFTYYSSKKTPDSIVYSAFIVEKNYKFPKFIPLFEEKQLSILLKNNKSQQDKTRIDGQYLNKAISDLFLKPLEKELEGVTTIYLSPSGLGHQIDFAALPIGDSQTLGEKYKLHILGSPAAIMDYKVATLDRKSNLELLLYGGIDYDKTNSVATLNSEILENNEPLKELQTRSGISEYGYLAGSKKEVEQIQVNGNKNGFKTTLLDDRNATEESIKQLDGRTTPFVLHLATHGYFFPDPEQEIPKHFDLEIEKSKIYKASANPMLRSGLIFAGANRFWSKAVESTTTDDGIMTASEISNLDLSACQLVVLSACETGLGEVKGSEGVFGLQRAFKMAGVKNIIMSLWKVPDAQTAELFEVLYNECFTGKSIHESFQIAQTKMKAKYSPYYWAGFVLLE